MAMFASIAPRINKITPPENDRFSRSVTTRVLDSEGILSIKIIYNPRGLFFFVVYNIIYKLRWYCKCKRGAKIMF